MNTTKIASHGILCILSLIVIFHLMVLLGIIPYDIVWGGRLTSYSQMITFELVSIFLNVIMLAVVGIKAKMLKVKLNPMIIQIALWLMTLLFFINTIGNMLSINEFEKWFFTPLTFLLSILSFRLAIVKENKVVAK